MKIAFDAKRLFNNTSGLGNYSRDLVRILATYYPDNEYILLNKNLSERGKEILELPHVFFEKTSSGKLARQYQMGKDAQNLQADIFHGLSGELPLKWNAQPIKKIVTIHDLIFERYPQYYSWFDRKIHLWKFKKAAQSADRIIAISEQTKLDIIQFLNVSENKITVVYQGCHQAFKQDFNEVKASILKEKHHLPDRFLLNVGTVEPRKNAFSIVQAIQNTEIPLVIVGRKTAYSEKIKRFLKRNKMESQVVFLEGFTMEELALLYKMADIFVYPSFFEGFGIPVIEALFSRTPVITSGKSSLPEAGGNGALYIDPENPKDLSAKIKFLWNHETERKRIAEIGFKYVQKFSDENIAKEMNSVYQDVLKN